MAIIKIPFSDHKRQQTFDLLKIENESDRLDFSETLCRPYNPDLKLPLGLYFEAKLYKFARSFCEEFKTGFSGFYWDFYFVALNGRDLPHIDIEKDVNFKCVNTLPNWSGFAAPSRLSGTSEPFHFISNMNYADCNLSPLSIGIALTIYAFSSIFPQGENDHIIHKMDLLKDFASLQNDYAEIYKAID